MMLHEEGRSWQWLHAHYERDERRRNVKARLRLRHSLYSGLRDFKARERAAKALSATPFPGDIKGVLTLHVGRVLGASDPCYVMTPDYRREAAVVPLDPDDRVPARLGFSLGDVVPGPWLVGTLGVREAFWGPRTAALLAFHPDHAPKRSKNTWKLRKEWLGVDSGTMGLFTEDQMVATRSGYGDGGYCVWEARVGGRTVGLAVVFIPKGNMARRLANRCQELLGLRAAC